MNTIGKYLHFFHTTSPLHAGSGSELGVVDLPIQRERPTDFPKIEASSLKGALRESFERRMGVDYQNGSESEPKIEAIFGPEDPQGSEDSFAGAAMLTDARLLLFPVKSVKGVFAWATCPFALGRFASDLEMVGQDKVAKTLRELTEGLKGLEEKALVGEGSSLLMGSDIVLEEFKFSAETNGDINSLAGELVELFLSFKETQWHASKLSESLVVLPDSEFEHFARHSTEVITRIKINNLTGTVEQGALFNEEYVPVDAVFYSMSFLRKEFFPKAKEKAAFSDGDDEAKSFYTEHFPETIQIGGNATLGKGICRVVTPSK